MKILTDELADLMARLEQNETQKDIARHFGRERKWVGGVKSGQAVRLDTDFLVGLSHYGYRLELKKIEEKERLRR